MSGYRVPFLFLHPRGVYAALWGYPHARSAGHARSSATLRGLAEAALAVAIASAVVAVGSVIISWRQLHQARVANLLPTAIGLFREFRNMTGGRHRLSPVLADIDIDVPLTKLPLEIRDDALRLAHFLDNLGFLVAEGLVRPEHVAGFLGTAVLDTWQKLGPHIYAERALRRELHASPDYQRYFEDLAERVREVDPTRVRSTLKEWRGAGLRTTLRRDEPV
jgi:hypothetical protein